MHQFLFIFETVAPVFLIPVLGIFLKKWKIINDQFVKDASCLVFTVALPALIFIKLAATDFSQTFDGKQVLYVMSTTTLGFGAVWSIASIWIKKGRDIGPFVQGAYRSNYAIVGFAVILNIFGDTALAKASVLLAFVMPLYNFLAVIVLTVPLHNEAGNHWAKSLFNILRNPLIIATLFSLPFSIFHIDLPKVVIKTGNYLAAMALPVALISIGGSLNLEAIKKASKLAIIASALKLIVTPTLFIWGAILLGYRGENLGVMFILFGSPAAVASFVMAKTMGANSKLAGNIVLISTLVSCLTITLGLTILMNLGYIE